MNLETFLLFVSCLVFAAFNSYVNMKTATTWLKLLSMLLMLAGIFLAGLIIIAVLV